MQIADIQYTCGQGCQVSDFEPDCPVLGQIVRLKISARTGHKYTDVYICILYTDPDPQFLAPARSLEIGQECPVFDMLTWQPYVWKTPYANLRRFSDEVLWSTFHNF